MEKQCIQEDIKQLLMRQAGNPEPLICTIRGLKHCMVTQFHIGPHGFLPECCQDADVIYFILGNSSFDMFKIPTNVQCLQLVPCPISPSNWQYVRMFVGEVPYPWECCDMNHYCARYLITRGEPKLKVPFGCRIYFGDREIDVT
jgi:hypothetical protein